MPEPSPLDPREELREALAVFFRDGGPYTPAGVRLHNAAREVLESTPSSHPQEIEHEGKTYRNVGPWGESHVKKDDLIFLAPNRLRIAQYDYAGMTNREIGWLQCAAYLDAALYRAEPRTVTYTATSCGNGWSADGRVDYGFPEGTKIEITIREVL